MALRCFGYCLASQSRAATRSRVPTAMANAHKFSTSQLAVCPNVPRSQETTGPMIPDRTAAALPAKLPRARPRVCRCFFFTHSFKPLLSGGLGAGAGALPPPPVSASTRVEIAMQMAVGIDAMVIPCSRNRVQMRSASVVSECLTDSVDLGPEGCSIRGEGFKPCLPFKLGVREYTLELSGSISNLSLYFNVVGFRQFSMLPSEVSFDLGFSVVDTRQLCQVVCLFISHSRHCLFEPSQLSSGLGDTHDVNWLIINRRQGGLNLFCALTCAVGYAGEVLEFDVIKVARVIVDTVGAQLISTVHFLIKGINQALLLGLKFGERLDDYLRAFYHVFMGEPTLYIIDDCSLQRPRFIRRLSA